MYPQSADQILEYYNKQRNSLASSCVNDDLSKTISLIPRDIYCHYNSDSHRTLRNQYRCYSCELLTKLSDTHNNFKILVGKNMGKSLKLTTSRSQLRSNLIKTPRGDVVVSDQTTHKYVLNCLIEAICQGVKVPSPTNILTSFICRDSFNLLEEDNQGEEEWLDELEMIIKQVLIILHILIPYSFIANLDWSKLVIIKEKVKYDYNGFKIESNYRVKFNNLGNSFLSIRNKEGKVIKYAYKLSENKSQTLCEYYVSGDQKKNYIKAKKDLFTQQLNGDMYLKSLDWYTFCIYLYSNPKTSETFKKMKYWDLLWLPSEKDNAKVFQKGLDYNELCNFKLNINAISEAFC